jgi:hypothetical protein
LGGTYLVGPESTLAQQYACQESHYSEKLHFMLRLFAAQRSKAHRADDARQCVGRTVKRGVMRPIADVAQAPESSFAVT